MFFQSNLMKGYDLAFTETASDATSRWRGTMMMPVSKFGTPSTSGSRTRRLCSEGARTETLSTLPSASHGAQSNVCSRDPISRRGN